MNIVIPMAGAGARFKGTKYDGVPKPLIEINGTTMIEVVLDNFSLDGQYYFIVNESHIKDFDIDKHLRDLIPDCRIIPVNYRTDGPACSVLLADFFINNSEELLTANCDQVFPWNARYFSNRFDKYDGALLTFECNEPHHSYVKIGPDGFATEVAEKKVISNRASNGVYYWRQGRFFVNSVKEAIRLDHRADNGEFYVGPAYNELIRRGGLVVEYPIKCNNHIGTPEELDKYMHDYDNDYSKNRYLSEGGDPH